MAVRPFLPSLVTAAPLEEARAGGGGVSAGPVGPGFLSGRPWVHNGPLFPAAARPSSGEGPRLEGPAIWGAGGTPGSMCCERFSQEKWVGPAREGKPCHGWEFPRPPDVLPEEVRPGACDTRHCASRPQTLSPHCSSKHLSPRGSLCNFRAAPELGAVPQGTEPGMGLMAPQSQPSVLESGALSKVGTLPLGSCCCQAQGPPRCPPSMKGVCKCTWASDSRGSGPGRMVLVSEIS